MKKKILVIAEKPSVAKTISKVVGATWEKDHYESDEYFITNVYGHMYTLADVKEYEDAPKTWGITGYPFYPNGFKYKVSQREGIKEQIEVIKKLLLKSSSVIDALDDDREGNLIFHELQIMLPIEIPVKKVCVSTQTEEGFKKALKKLENQNLPVTNAGKLRQEIDWYIGINSTVLFTVKSRAKKAFKLGRVILPTLYMIYKREGEILNFKGTTYYSLFEGQYQYIEGKEKGFQREKLENLIKKFKGEKFILLESKKEKSYIKPKKLFSLTELQKEMTEKYNQFTASSVLEIAQKLYENGYTTYPRTESRYLEETLKNDVFSILERYQDQYDIVKRNDVFNDEKVNGHHAIILTEKYPIADELSKNEKIVYSEIEKRFLSNFMDDGQIENIEIILKTEGLDGSFVYKNKSLVKEGFMSVTGHSYKILDFDEILNSRPQNLGESIDLREINTKPPKRYTEATLLSAMMNCGKSVENEENVLKGFTVGTPATRAETINKLIESEYVNKKGKSFYLSERGQYVIENFPSDKFLSASYTGQIEKALNEISIGLAPMEDKKEKINSSIKAELMLLKDSSMEPIKNDDDPIVVGECPICKGDVLAHAKTFKCANKKCKFILWKKDKFLEKWGVKTLTKVKVEKLLKKGYFLFNGKYEKKKAQIELKGGFVNWKIEKEDSK